MFSPQATIQANILILNQVVLAKRVWGVMESFAQWDGKSALSSGIGSGYSNVNNGALEIGESKGGRYRL